MKRDQLLRELRKYAKAHELDLEVFEDKGKGSHYRVTLNGKMTTIKSGELTPLYVQIIKKQLGVV